MLILYILLYLAIGFLVTAIYNAVHNVPIEMEDEQAYKMICITIFWPIIVIRKLPKIISYIFKI